MRSPQRWRGSERRISFWFLLPLGLLEVLELVVDLIRWARSGDLESVYLVAHFLLVLLVVSRGVSYF